MLRRDLVAVVGNLDVAVAAAVDIGLGSHLVVGVEVAVVVVVPDIVLGMDLLEVVVGLGDRLDIELRKDPASVVFAAVEIAAIGKGLAVVVVVEARDIDTLDRDLQSQQLPFHPNRNHPILLRNFFSEVEVVVHLLLDSQVLVLQRTWNPNTSFPIHNGAWVVPYQNQEEAIHHQYRMVAAGVEILAKIVPLGRLVLPQKEAAVDHRKTVEFVDTVVLMSSLWKIHTWNPYTKLVLDRIQVRRVQNCCCCYFDCLHLDHNHQRGCPEKEYLVFVPSWCLQRRHREDCGWDR